MTTTVSTPSVSPLTSWLSGGTARSRLRGRRPAAVAVAGLRFAFYGRTSTSRQQDPETSREWQRDDAARVIDGHGQIVTEFFDVGYSRSLPWHLRPQAAALLRAAARPDRGFDAVVIGEFERAFAGRHARAGIWVAGRRTGIAWLMPGRIPTGSTLRGAVGCCGSTRIRKPPRTCGGSSRSVSPGTARPVSPAP